MALNLPAMPLKLFNHKVKTNERMLTNFQNNLGDQVVLPLPASLMHSGMPLT